MKKTYSTQTAAKKIGVSFRTLNRWLALGLIRSSRPIPIGGGRTLWLWTDTDIARGRKVKAKQHPGPKPKRRKP
jgi:DNA-binding transcriptional MerR regulator